MRTRRSPSDTNPRLAVYVRLTQEEHDELRTHETQSGESAAVLLKKRYFENKVLNILMPQEDRAAIRKELTYWGNNLNQIAKRLNSGFNGNVVPEVLKAINMLSSIERKVVSIYANSILRVQQGSQGVG